MKDKTFYIKHSLLALLTLSRLPLTFITTMLILKDEKISFPLFFFYCLALCTDFIDGKLARSLKLTSKHGAVLDLGSDAVFIFSTGLALHQLQIFPLWLIFLIFLKLFEFLLTSRLLRKRRKETGLFLFDKLGRAVSAGYYVLPLFLLTLKTYLDQSLFKSVSSFLFYFFGFFTLITLLHRLSFLIKKKGRN